MVAQGETGNDSGPIIRFRAQTRGTLYRTLRVKASDHFFKSQSQAEIVTSVLPWDLPDCPAGDDILN